MSTINVFLSSGKFSALNTGQNALAPATKNALHIIKMWLTTASQSTITAFLYLGRVTAS